MRQIDLIQKIINKKKVMMLYNNKRTCVKKKFTIDQQSQQSINKKAYIHNTQITMSQSEQRSGLNHHNQFQQQVYDLRGYGQDINKFKRDHDRDYRDKLPLQWKIKKKTAYLCLGSIGVIGIVLLSVYVYYFGQYYPCPTKYVVNYVWVGDRAKLPSKYSSYLQRCKPNVNLLQQTHLQHYIKLWNSQQPQHQITPLNFRPKKLIADKADLLRKLYLYYQSGIYADFDTQINEQCFDGIITNQIIFTNSWGFQRNIVMAQQNFIRVINKKNHYMKYWIIAQLSQIYQSDLRWNLCKYKPCFIINCQKHNYDRTWIG